MRIERVEKILRKIEKKTECYETVDEKIEKIVMNELHQT